MAFTGFAEEEAALEDEAFAAEAEAFLVADGAAFLMFFLVVFLMLFLAAADFLVTELAIVVQNKVLSVEQLKKEWQD